ncbi:unnamed protein product [Macrosiphum euphorbiae]|uniref:DNA endonuclease activator Ctp1 C-terminal domain-containing protein n=1 Tax=Macrosiphum euphorbiae TaxID=13131 RepID=A0AAV0VN54_9HEMI|nr:unnamed protein product [Macrosiphum euphorbiae]
MNNQNDGEAHVQMLTDVCQNVCTFIKTITMNNMSNIDKLNTFEIKINDLQCICSKLKTKLEQINEQVKTLASLLNFATDQDASAIDILTQWILSLSNKNIEYPKKRKLYTSYSPLKLSLKDKTEINESTKNKPMCTKPEKENKIKCQNELNNIWKLQVKRDGNPSDLLKKSKQTTLMLQPQKEKMKMDITTFSSPTPKISVLNSSSLFSPEMLNLKNYTTNDNTICETNIIHNTELNDSTNISLSNFNAITKPSKNTLSIIKTNFLKSKETNTSHGETEKHDHSNDETNCSPINISMSVLNNATTLKKQIKIPNGNLLDSFDIIPGLNDKKNDLPNYKFKEDPVRKHNERKLLNGWDCKDCCKFYEENNDNPIDAKNAMNHFSRHRSHKHQHHAPTPPGFWDPL